MFLGEVSQIERGICHISVMKAGRMEQDVSAHLFYIRFWRKNLSEKS